MYEYDTATTKELTTALKDLSKVLKAEEMFDK